MRRLPRLVSAAEIRAECGVSEHEAYALMRDTGRLVRRGSRVYVYQSDLERVLADATEVVRPRQPRAS